MPTFASLWCTMQEFHWTFTTKSNRAAEFPAPCRRWCITIPLSCSCRRRRRLSMMRQRRRQFIDCELDGFRAKQYSCFYLRIRSVHIGWMWHTVFEERLEFWPGSGVSRIATHVTFACSSVFGFSRRTTIMWSLRIKTHTYTHGHTQMNTHTIILTIVIYTNNWMCVDSLEFRLFKYVRYTIIIKHVVFRSHNCFSFRMCCTSIDVERHYMHEQHGHCLIYRLWNKQRPPTHMQQFKLN